MTLKCNNWLLIEKFKKEREQYEKYTNRITKEKILIAKSKIDDVDKKILQTIYKLKICTSTQLSKIIYSNVKFANRYINNRLKKLFNLGCIDRFFPAKEKGSYPVHVILAPIGAKILEISNFKKTTLLNQKWRHTVFLNEILSNILMKYRVKIYRIEMWIERNEDFKIRADMFCGWIKNEKIIFSILELDMGTELMKDVIAKVKKYNKYFNSEYFKKANWQPYKEKNIAIIPKIIFVFNDSKREITFKNFINKYKTNIKFEVMNIENLNF